MISFRKRFLKLFSVYRGNKRKGRKGSNKVARIKEQEIFVNPYVVQMDKFAFPLLGVFILMGALVGSIGSAISIGKYLRHEGSEFNAIF